MPSLGTAFFKIVCKGIAFADTMFNPNRICIRRRTSDARPLQYAKLPFAVLNSTPFVRQYGILLTNGVLLYAKREAKQEIHWGV